jgi:hypothetical protein
MKRILLVLHPFADDQAATVLDDIKNAGTINYTDASGATVNVTVGDVSVQDVPESADA